MFFVGIIVFGQQQDIPGHGKKEYHHIMTNKSAVTEGILRSLPPFLVLTENL